MWAVVVGLLVIVAMTGMTLWNWAVLVARAGWAQEQVEIFYEMRDRSLSSDPIEALDSWEYAAGYYPSGTKQVPESHLDMRVELVRKNVIRAILDDLRKRTGRDFGDDIELWRDGLCNL